jgi:hypothetical protein
MAYESAILLVMALGNLEPVTDLPCSCRFKNRRSKMETAAVPNRGAVRTGYGTSFENGARFRYTECCHA